jgi:hypothetical protein
MMLFASSELRGPLRSARMCISNANDVTPQQPDIHTTPTRIHRATMTG